MYARAVAMKMQQGKEAEGTRIYRDSIVPAARSQKGFRGATLLTDPETGDSLSITYWETEEDLRAGEERGYYQEQIDRIAPLAASRPERKVYEVRVQAEAQAAFG
jgi:heme-degrading monooxygenase HmoA